MMKVTTSQCPTMTPLLGLRTSAMCMLGATNQLSSLGTGLHVSRLSMDMSWWKHEFKTELTSVSTRSSAAVISPMDLSLSLSMTRSRIWVSSGVEKASWHQIRKAGSALQKNLTLHVKTQLTCMVLQLRSSVFQISTTMTRSWPWSDLKLTLSCTILFHFLWMQPWQETLRQTSFSKTLGRQKRRSTSLKWHTGQLSLTSMVTTPSPWFRSSSTLPLSSTSSLDHGSSLQAFFQTIPSGLDFPIWSWKTTVDQASLAGMWYRSTCSGQTPGTPLSTYHFTLL